jgi:hypothetical protein
MPAARTGEGGGGRHKLFVEIANLKMAKARQKRIRAALQSQADRREANIASIEQRIEGLYRQAGLEESDADPPERGSDDEAEAAGRDARTRGDEAGEGDKGFAYQY